MNHKVRYEKMGKNWSVAVRNDYLAKKHWHNEYEILYVMAGTTYVNVDGVNYEVISGETFFISPGAVHYYAEPSEFNKICVVRLTEEFLKCFSVEVKHVYTVFLSDVLHIRENPRISVIIEEIQTVFEIEEEVFVESILIGKSLELLIYLYQNQFLISERASVRRNNDSECMDKMIEYIREHLQDKITLSDVAVHLGFSESYCSKYIKKKTNMNFLEYLNNERIEKAKQMLRLSDAPVTEIAYITGFSSIQSFNRVFKSFCEVSPTEYRKRIYDQKSNILDKI